MNNKQSALMQIVEIVVTCCATKNEESGTLSVCKEDVLGKSRVENVVMTRCILASQIVGAGYSVTTVAQLLGRTTSAVRRMLEQASTYYRSSKAYRIADAEATLLCRNIFDV